MCIHELNIHCLKQLKFVANFAFVIWLIEGLLLWSKKFFGTHTTEQRPLVNRRVWIFCKFRDTTIRKAKSSILLRNEPNSDWDLPNIYWAFDDEALRKLRTFERFKRFIEDCETIEEGQFSQEPSDCREPGQCSWYHPSGQTTNCPWRDRSCRYIMWNLPNHFVWLIRH